MERYHKNIMNDNNSIPGVSSTNPSPTSTIPTTVQVHDLSNLALPRRRMVNESADHSADRPMFLFTHDYVPKKTCHEVISLLLEQQGVDNDTIFDIKNKVDEKVSDMDQQIIDQNLTEDEAVSIIYYTLENNPSIYSLVNNELIGRQLCEEWKCYVYYLASGLEKLPNNEQHLFRGIKVALSENSHYKVDNIITWVSFTSTSEERRTIDGFIKDTNKSTCLILEAKNGKSISCFSTYPLEKEMIVCPNTTFMVKEILSPTMKSLLGKAQSEDYLIMEEIQSSVSFPGPLIRTMTLPNPFNLAFEGKLEQLKHWFDYDMQRNVNIVNKERKNSPLMYTAASNGHCEIVDWLIEKKADLNACQDDKSTALHVASVKGFAGVVRLLLSRGADWKLRNKWNKTAYEEADHQFQSIKLIIETQPNIVTTSSYQMKDQLEQTCNIIRMHTMKY